MACGLRAFCGDAGFSDWGALLPYSDLFVSVVCLLTSWSGVFCCLFFPFWDTGLPVPRNPSWPWSHNLVCRAECWDCWCGHSCLVVTRPPLGVCRCVSLCFQLCFSAYFIFLCLRLWRVTPSLNMQLHSLWSWPQQCFQVAVWDSCLQLWTATDFSCTNRIQNVREDCFLHHNYFVHVIIFLCLLSPCLDIVIF